MNNDIGKTQLDPLGLPLTKKGARHPSTEATRSAFSETLGALTGPDPVRDESFGRPAESPGPRSQSRSANVESAPGLEEQDDPVVQASDGLEDLPTEPALAVIGSRVQSPDTFTQNATPPLREPALSGLEAKSPTASKSEGPVSGDPMTSVRGNPGATGATVRPVESSPRAVSDFQSREARIQKAQRVAKVRPPPPPPEIAQQLLDKLKLRVSKDNANAEIRLDPPELGKVIMEIEEVEGRLVAKLRVGHDAVLDAAQRYFSELEKMFAQAGVALDRFDIAKEKGSSPRDQKPPRSSAETSQDEGDSSKASTSRTPWGQPGAMIDVIA